MINSGNKFLLLLLVALMLFLSGCAFKRHVRIGMKYEQAEMHQLAVDNYLLSLQKKYNNNDAARIGLMRAAKRFSDELEMKINDAYVFMQDDQVVAFFLQLRNLKDKSALYNVDVDISQKTLGQFEEARNRHLRLTYTRAQEMLESDRFAEAERMLAEVIQIDRNYERAGELYAFARCEPLYREARQLMDAKLYRSAYHTFSRLLNMNSAYKDARVLQREAMQFAILTIAMQPFKNAYAHPYLTAQIQEAVKQEFLRNNNPFLRFVSTDHTQKMLEEQRLALANGLPFDISMVIPVRVFLTAGINNAQYTTSGIRKTEQKAYWRYVDKNRQLQYKKVFYFVHEQTANAYFQCAYEFARVENSIIIAVDKVEKTYTDRVQYARSEYDPKDLFPADWGAGVKDTMYTDNARVYAMRQLFDARSDLINREGFERMFAGAVAIEMYKKISAYDPEK